MKNVLIYNQSETNMEVLKIFLAQEGYQVYVVSRLEDVIRRVGQKDIHLVVMDIDFPQNDGVERLKEIRNTDRMPIIVLSANDREQMKIAALNAGADDYVIYPFHPLEFMARINSQFRRYIQLVNMRNNIDRIYRVDDLVMNDVLRKVTVSGKEVSLTPIEYKILRLLVQERGKVFSINQIYESIWNMQAIGADNTIAVHIRHIREKIERNPKEPHYLKVVWGTGYKVG
ncbi:MAG: response regulator transcription factor [Lachnospiraceae bacterium]|nr:response regulator transcription factor [Lachnospiraceae bacterium]MCI9107180.1 response regulator transcription factor [Lachnospiraceae bacterium]MCI9341827.1 response regulator transcription factor [Lachnospiraceae bacterium]GFH89147.1 KDP operon transcriptional regulatory protein KdpE [Lachnospiraceae bacterium]